MLSLVRGLALKKMTAKNVSVPFVVESCSSEDSTHTARYAVRVRIASRFVHVAAGI